jgi:hypothetical protein
MTSTSAQSLPRRPVPPRRLGLLAVGLLLIAAAVAAVILATGHPDSATASSGARYGGLPNWLPKAKVPVGRVLTATPAKPALTIQGESVSVHLGGGTVLATVAGPTVPEEGEFPVPSTSPCTFVLTLAKATGNVSIDPSDFTVTDDEGQVHRMHVAALDGGAPPRSVGPGRTVSLRIHGVLPTGDGGLSWAPAGGRPIVSWDFDVEID